MMAGGKFAMGLRWLLVTGVMAVAVGSACALFLWSLDEVTGLRFRHPWLLYFLPVAGLLVGLVYHRWGKSAEGGNNLLIDEIHEPGAGVPRRMAPLVLAGTLMTHLCGGSAGREGTALQMGGSIAGWIGRLCGLDAEGRRVLLMGGIAAGFGGVFGTPWAGAVFAMEVLVSGRLRWRAALPCLLAAWVADWTVHAWSVGHLHYQVGVWKGWGFFRLDGWLLAQAAVAGIAFGWVARLFSEAIHRFSSGMKRVCGSAPLRPVIGAVLVIGLVWVSGTREFLGLGVSSPNPEDVTILSLFGTTEVHPWAWAWKLVFTVVTLGAGFKGGEVTPLFFIGAALGNAIGGMMGAPLDLFAAMGFVAVFAGATNTPLACTIMGMELFGVANGAYLGIACVTAFLNNGKSGIYLSQRFVRDGKEISLRNLREKK